MTLRRAKFTANNKNKLISGYKATIKMVIALMETPQSTEELAVFSELISDLIVTTFKLIRLWSEDGRKQDFAYEIGECNLLLKDLNEILIDIHNRISLDTEIAELLYS